MLGRSAARPLGFPSSRRPSTTSRGCSPRSPLPAAIFESLQLTVTYFHKTHEAEVEIVLRDEERHGQAMVRSMRCPRWGLDQSSDDYNG